MDKKNKEKLLEPPPSYDEVVAEEGKKLSQKQLPKIPSDIKFGRSPVKLICPTCNYRTESEVKMRINEDAHFLALFLCTLGLCFCSCLPFRKKFRNSVHYCPKCQHKVGIYSPEFE